MNKNVATALLIALMIGTVIGVDLLFFGSRPWERFTANVGIVLVFAAFYYRFLH
jgi:TM2 domain-containing membrane protein YozV